MSCAGFKKCLARSMRCQSDFRHPYWTASIAQRFSALLAKPFILFFLHFRVYGQENFKSLPNGVILASNHVTNADGELLSASFDIFSKRLPLYYVAGEKSFYQDNVFQIIFYAQVILRLFGAYSAVFGTRDYEKSLALHIDLLKRGKNVVIFPEGHRSKDGRLLPAKGGVVALARFSGAPVVPVAISGNLHMTLSDFFQRRRFVKICFGKAILSKELFLGYENSSPSEYKKIAEERIMKKIEELRLAF